jgi:hypothetical protein
VGDATEPGDKREQLNPDLLDLYRNCAVKPRASALGIEGAFLVSGLEWGRTASQGDSLDIGGLL